MSQFPILLREGVFDFPEGAPFSVSTEKGVDVLADLLAPFEGRRVRLAAHHLPVNPPDPTKWGGGSCLWTDRPPKKLPVFAPSSLLLDLPEGKTWCPAGHHVRPSLLYNKSSEGILSRMGSETWALECADGTWDVFDLGLNMEGHVGRIACALVMSVDEMRDVLGNTSHRAEGLAERATDLKDLMAQLKNLVGGR